LQDHINLRGRHAEQRRQLIGHLCPLSPREAIR